MTLDELRRRLAAIDGELAAIDDTPAPTVDRRAVLARVGALETAWQYATGAERRAIAARLVESAAMPRLAIAWRAVSAL